MRETIPSLLAQLEVAVSDAQGIAIRLAQVADTLDGQQPPAAKPSASEFHGGVDVRSWLADLLAALRLVHGEARISLSRLDGALDAGDGGVDCSRALSRQELHEALGITPSRVMETVVPGRDMRTMGRPL